MMFLKYEFPKQNYFLYDLSKCVPLKFLNDNNTFATYNNVDKLALQNRSQKNVFHSSFVIYIKTRSVFK
jgi:hypothetical protein